MRLYRVNAERTCVADCLVMAKDAIEAEKIMKRAIEYGAVDLDENNPRNPIEIDSLLITDINDTIVKELKDYGALNEESKFVYGEKIAKEIKKQMEEQQKEEYLKKHHMEFDFTNK